MKKLRQILFENEYDVQENFIDYVYGDVDPSDGSRWVHLHDSICYAFDVNDTSVIIPRRYVYNSWPFKIDYGKIHKGELLKAGVISWFAQEEEMQFFRRDEQRLN